MWKKRGKFEVEFLYNFEVTNDFSSHGSLRRKPLYRNNTESA